MTDWRYTQGLHEVGAGTFAWLQPDGSWGWSNAGLITDGDASLLVDTLFDLKLTRQMLDAMADAAPAARQIGVVVNTHANGDHCYGNQLVSDAEIIASRRGAAEMNELPPARVALLLRVARTLIALGGPGRTLANALGAVGLKKLQHLSTAAPFVQEIFGEFEFGGITFTPPTRTFDDQLDLQVGDKAVTLIEVGPAHTQGDVLVHLPGDEILFSGDILFIDGHPIVWEGPVSNWIRACDRIVALEPVTVVPGHGPITDLDGVRRLRDYLAYLETEARARYEAGMSWFDAALDISFADFRTWTEAERVVVNVHTVYRELRGDTRPADVIALFAAMARARAKL